MNQYDSNKNIYVESLANDPNTSQRRNYSDQGEVPGGTGGWAHQVSRFQGVGAAPRALTGWSVLGTLPGC